jgi:hypothetical protein
MYKESSLYRPSYSDYFPLMMPESKDIEGRYGGLKALYFFHSTESSEGVCQQQIMCSIIVIETFFFRHFETSRMTSENKCCDSGLLVLV